MPLRGETVGTAYVRILADGSELPGQLEDQLRDQEDTFSAAGRRDSKAYQDAFAKGLGDEPKLLDLQKALNRSIATADVTNAFFDGPGWKRFEKNLETRFGAAGRIAAIEFSQEFGEKGSLEGLTDAIEEIHPRIARIRREIVEEGRAISNSFEETFTDLEATVKKSSDTISDKTKEMADDLDDFGDAAERNERRAGHAFRRTANQFDKLAVPIGRLLGRGSRNNFLNFFGSVITNSLKMGTAIFKVFDGIVSVVKKSVGTTISLLSALAKNFNATGDDFRSFSSILAGAGLTATFSTIATGGLNIAAAVGAMALAFGLAAVSAGILISALLLLAGIVTALAASIQAALIATLASLGPLLIPLAGIIGGIIATVVKFKDATGPLADALENVKDRASDLFEVFDNQAFRTAPRLVNRIATEMKSLNKFTAAAGDGFRKFATQIVKTATGPELDKFTKQFTKFLPDASKQLGIIFGNTFEGLAGVLRASIPLAEDLLNWLVDLTDRFSEFTNSPEGQKKIRKFLTEAAESAKALGGFLKELTGLIQDVFDAGRDEGDSIFTDMTNGLKDVRQFLKENPDALKNFFRDARDFALTLGDAIDKVTKAIDRIDTPATRKAAGMLITAFSHTIFFMSLLVSAITTGVGSIKGAFRNMAQFALTIFGLMAQAGIISAAYIVGAFERIPGPVGDAAGRAKEKLLDLSDSVGETFGAMGQVVDGLTAKIEEPKTFNLDTSAALQKLNFLQNIAQQVMNALNNAVNAAANAPVGGPGGNSTIGGHETNDRTVNPQDRITINVSTTTADPRAVAVETLNRLVALGY